MTNFGSDEVVTALQAAETECERVAAVRSTIDQEACEFMLDHLKHPTKTAKNKHSWWKQWIPETNNELCVWLRELELHILWLVSKKAEFIQARIKEDTGRQSLGTGGPSHPKPSIKLQSIFHPKFSGNRRDFHREKRDWEALQSQGKPTGSWEVKKAQLLNIIDDRVEKDLRLTSYNTQQRMFSMYSRTIMATQHLSLSR